MSAGPRMESSRWGRSPRPLIIGHRGASAHAIENTLEAFRRARQDGADGIELDVQLCATGEAVVFHDDDLRRLAGRGERIRDLSLSDLRQVRLGDGGAIPVLAEVFEELGAELLVNVELKSRRLLDGRRLAAEVATVVRAHGAEQRTLVSSFNPAALVWSRRVAPDIPIALLCAADHALPLREGWARFGLHPLAIHPDRALVHEPSMARWHTEGLAVNVWTVDDPTEIRRLRLWGADGIICNDPQLARRSQR